VLRILSGSGFQPMDITLIFEEKTFSGDDDTLIGDLNLTSPQKIGIKVKVNERMIGAGGSAGSASKSGKIAPGWDMGIAVGGTIKQAITEDKSPHFWNWKAARTVNIQIINTVAFQAVTGLSPPLSQLSFTRQFVKGVPGTQEPASIKESMKTIDRLQYVKSVNELDWERGAALGVLLDGKSVVLCVCCEANICDSV